MENESMAIPRGAGCVELQLVRRADGSMRAEYGTETRHYIVRSFPCESTLINTIAELNRKLSMLDEVWFDTGSELAACYIVEQFRDNVTMIDDLEIDNLLLLSKIATIRAVMTLEPRISGDPRKVRFDFRDDMRRGVKIELGRTLDYLTELYYNIHHERDKFKINY